MKIFKAVVIGLGRQSISDHIPAVLDSRCCVLDSVCDTDKDRLYEISENLGVPGFTSLEELITLRRPDFAIVAVPHSEYLEIIKILARAKIHILKEKPLASSIREALEISAYIEENDIKMQISTQRRFNPIFTALRQLSGRIGHIYSVEAKYAMNVQDLSSGWRAKRSLSGGGAVIDMGYHYIDLLIWFFGLPDEIFARISCNSREGQEYDVEDTAFIDFTYSTSPEEKILGSLLISRAYPEKEESFDLIGTKGSIHLKNGSIRAVNHKGEVLEELFAMGGWNLAVSEQLEDFLEVLGDGGRISPHLQHLQHMAFTEAAYRSAELKTIFNPKNLISKELWKH